ncbi:MAG: tRNA lysidine(34) synthetase TilS [Clostridia bacterium]|nr:tRNA lysidine(34) synthetase TilS [Clostridia bacterium]
MTAEFCFEDARGRHLLAALSGGADSVALLHLLAERRSELSIQLTAAHLHHGIRGAEADGDLAFCREICRELGVELIEGRLDIPAIAAGRRIGIETAAREERRRFLREAQEKCGADWIALAHHMDDQAETILMHLFRGTGPEGICGMPRLRDGLYRPLLGVRRDALRKYLEARGISWREDGTNAVPDNPRNAIRLNVLPEIEKSYPHCIEAIARHGRIAAIEGESIARMAELYLANHLERGPYGQRLDLSGMPEEAVLRRCIRRLCPDSLAAAKLDEIISMAQKPRGRLEISGSLTVERTGRRLYFLPKGIEKPAAVPLNTSGETILPGICRVFAEAGTFEIDREHREIEVLDAGALEGAALRTRREGDRFHPLGAPGDRLLSDYLTDKKIDRPIRDFLPLICVGNRVLWIGGMGIAQDARIQENTMRMVRITTGCFTRDE